MNTQSTTTTAIDTTTTTTLTRNEIAMTTTTLPAFANAIANVVATSVATPTPRKDTPMNSKTPLIHPVHTPTFTENPMTTDTTTTAIDTTTPTLTLTGIENAIPTPTLPASTHAIANDVATSVTTPTPRKDHTPMPPTVPFIHAVPSSTTTPEFIAMSDVDRSLITDRSLSTPCLDISLSDPVASLAAGPGNDPTASVHSLPAPACDTSPPASEERLTGGHEGAAPFQPRVLPKRLGFEVRRDHAEEELDWLHSPCALDPRHAGRRAVLMGWLDRLEPDDRAVIAFRYDRRVLSPMLADWVYVSTALVVALDIGIELVRDGIPDCVERSSVSHLEELILKRRTRHIDVLQRRAGRRFDEAVKALARVRGHVALVVPTPGEGQVTTATPITAQEMTG